MKSPWLICANAVVMVASVLGSAALANPQGGRVVAGSAAIVGEGTAHVTVTQRSDRAVIDWDSFSIAAGEHTEFRQPFTTSITANRVVGVDPSTIMGALSANGRLVLINRNGVLFGRGATVDVGGLVATSHDMDNDAFMAGGNIRFEGGGIKGAAVVNEGTITIHGAGVAAFVAPHVQNAGVIEADLGRVALGAGSGFTLDLYGDDLIRFAAGDEITETLTDANGTPLKALVENDGEIATAGGRVLLTAAAAREVVNQSVNLSGVVRADSVVQAGGVIRLAGSGTVTVEAEAVVSASGAMGGTVEIAGDTVELKGRARIDASGSAGDGGRVTLLGERVGLWDESQVIATGATGGGEVLVGGNYLGQGPEPNAKAVVMAPGARIDASATVAGDGGRVILWSDDYTGFYGSILAQGGASGGDGGFVETSSRDILQVTGMVDMGAPFGAAGQWLLDPTDVTITNATADGGFSGGVFTPDPFANTATIDASAINSALTTGNVSILTGSSGTQDGDIIISAPITYTGADARSLILDAADDIRGTGNITLHGNLFLSVNGANTGDDGGVENIYSGILANAAADRPLSLTKVGAGTVALTAQNTYTGATTVDEGVLALGSTAAIVWNIIPDSNTITVNGNGTLRFDNHDVFGDAATTASPAIIVNGGTLAANDSYTPIWNLTLNGGQLIADGGAANAYPAFQLAGTLTVTDDATIAPPGPETAVDRISIGGVGNSTLTIDVAAGKTLTISSALRDLPNEPGLSTLQKTGDGTLVLTGANSSNADGADYYGNTVINAGTLQVGNGGVTGELSLGAVTNNATLVFDRSNDLTIANVISGSGTLTASSDANLTINGAITQDGRITLTAGADDAAAGSAVANGAVTGGDVTLNANVDSTADTVVIYSGNATTSAYTGRVAGSASSLRKAYGETAGAAGVNAAKALNVFYRVIPTVTASGVTASNKVYDRTSVATIDTSGASITGGVIDGDSLQISAGATAVFDNENAGTGKTVIVSSLVESATAGVEVYGYLSDASVTADITPVTLTISGLTANNRVYDRTTAATWTGGSLDGILSGDTVTLNSGGALAAFDTKDVGINKTVTASGFALAGTDAGNYTLTQPTGLAADITAATLTITGLTANNRVYDRTTVATWTGGSLDGILSGDTVTLNSAGALAAFDTKDVGTNKTVTASGFALAGTDAGNYTLTQPSSLTADITPATLTISGLTANNRVYDRTTAATWTGGSLDGILSGDTVTLNGAGASAAFDTKDVGTNKTVTASGFALAGTDAGNYTLTQPTGLAADITAATLTITGLTANNRVYDRTTAATWTGGSLDGILSGDTVTLNGAGASAAFDTKDVGTNKTVTASGFALAGTDAGNYTLTQPTGLAADITAATLTITGLTANNRVYDRTTAATWTGGSLDGILSGDTVTLNGGGASAAFDTKDVGTNKTVTASGFALAGTDAGNYTLTQPTGLAADITAATLTITGSFTAADKVYDRTTTAVIDTGGLSLSGVLGGDTVTLNAGGAKGAFADRNVGTGKTIMLSGGALVGADAGNYVIDSGAPTTTADITPATLTVTVNNASRLKNAPDPAFSYTIAGFAPGDDESAVSGLAVATDATTASPAGAYRIFASGGSAQNYGFAYVDGVLTVSLGFAASDPMNDHLIRVDPTGSTDGARPFPEADFGASRGGSSFGAAGILPAPNLHGSQDMAGASETSAVGRFTPSVNMGDPERIYYIGGKQ